MPETFVCLYETNFKISTSLILSDNSLHQDFLIKKTKNKCKDVSMFFTFHHCSIEAEVIGKRVNQAGGYWLEISVRYHFVGPVKSQSG